MFGELWDIVATERLKWKLGCAGSPGLLWYVVGQQKKAGLGTGNPGYSLLPQFPLY